MSSSYVQIAGLQVATELLASVEVQQRLNQHWTCVVVFRSTPDQRPDLESMQGKPLKVVTYDLLGTEHVLFSGLVYRAAVRYEIWGSYGGTLEAVSLCWQMGQARRYAYYLKQAPQDIARQLAGGGGLELKGSITGDANASRVQWAETDYEFLLQLADDAESWVRPTETGLEVQTSFQPGVPLLWREGEYGLLEFSAGGRVQPQILAGTHYDPATMESRHFEGVQSEASFYDDAVPRLVEAAIASGQALPSDDHGNRQRSITLDDFDQRLQLESRRAAANAVVCRGVSREMQVTAGNEITIVGLPTGSGTYGVIACEHVWTGKGYENHFVATPVKRWFAQVRPPRATAGGLFPARLAANYDPHNQGRVQISFPWMTGAPTTWARLLMPHAGADRGFLFFPEMGDEVSVRFEGGDPERPVVIGSVWNGVQQPPTEGFWQPGVVNGTEFASNYIKRIVTKSGLRVTLNDTPGQESILLATPNSNQVLLTEKATETNRSAIALHTTGDILIHAPQGRAHLKAAKHSRHVVKPDPTKPKVIRIDGTQPGTPGVRNPGDQPAPNKLKSSTSATLTLSANKPAVLVRGGLDVTLTATTVPPDTQVAWSVAPNENKGAAPTITPTGKVNEAKLKTDKTGSFAVTATLGDTKVVWNVVFVWVQVLVGKTAVITRNNYFDVPPADKYPDGTIVPENLKSVIFHSGDFEAKKFAWEATVPVHLVGGGTSGKLGINRIKVHFLQNGTADTLAGVYGKDGGTGKETIGVKLPVVDTNGTDPPFPFIYSIFDKAPAKFMKITPNQKSQDRTMFNGDSPGGSFLRFHKTTHADLTQVLGMNGFVNAICSVSSDSPTEIVAHAQLGWQAHYDGIVTQPFMYNSHGYTLSDTAYSEISAGTGGQDAAQAGLETKLPIYVGQDANGKDVIDTDYEPK